MEHRVGLAEAIASLRAELYDAMVEGAGKLVQFQVGGVDLEFQAEVGREGEGSGKVRFWVVEAGASATARSSSTQTIKIHLEPHRRGHRHPGERRRDRRVGTPATSPAFRPQRRHGLTRAGRAGDVALSEGKVDGLRAVLKDCMARITQVGGGLPAGAAFRISETLLVTNRHVVGEGVTKVHVHHQGTPKPVTGKVLPPSVVDPDLDIALQPRGIERLLYQFRESFGEQLLASSPIRRDRDGGDVKAEQFRDRLHLANQLQAVVGHRDVAEQDMRSDALHDPLRLSGGRGGRHLRPAQLQRDPEHLAGVVGILNHQDVNTGKFR